MEYTAEQQQYQQQYQYQQQPSEAAAYDPSQYHQSAAYYAYPNQYQYDYNHQQQQQYQQFQYYPPQDPYSQQYSHYYQQDAAAAIHPPGVSPLDPSAHQSQPAFSYQPQPAAEPQQQVVPDSTAAPANFMGNANFVQRDNPPPQMQPANRGGRRGGKPFRGGTRGHVGKNGPRPGGSAPHNKGPGHSGNKQFSSNGVMLASSNSMLDPGGSAAVMPPSASVPGQATLSAQVPAAPVRPPPRMGWCELCRVDCNRPEILEQHKKGKRHQKNLQALEQQQKLNKVKTEQQSLQVPSSGSEVVQLKKLEGSEEKQHQQETLPPLGVTNESKNETEHQKDLVNTSEASTSHSVEGKRKLKDPSEVHGRGLKRKMRGGRGGKYMKSNEGPRRPVEPPKPKGGIPFMCELCNVKCESQVVFNSHLAGKKHIANMKRFHGHRAVYGEAGLQALYPPNANAPSASFIPQIQQGVTDPQVVLAQLLNYVLTQAQVSGLAAPQVPLLAATSTPSYLPVSSSENHYPSKFTQGSLATSEVRMGEVSKAEASPLAGNGKAKNEVTEQQYSIAEIKVPGPAGTQAENGALDSENRVASPPKDNTISATSVCLATACKTLLPSTSETDTGSECKTFSSDPVDTGSNNNLKEPDDDDPEEEEEEDPQEDVEEDLGTK